MFHSLALTNALAALAAFAPLAPAQVSAQVPAKAEPCPGLVIESAVHGTQRVPRGPRGQGDETLTPGP